MVWFKDASEPPDEQDHEWPACIFIAATDETDAQRWGDYLAARFCRSHPNNEFLHSYIDRDASGCLDQVPRIQVGDEATDEVIGW